MLVASLALLAIGLAPLPARADTRVVSVQPYDGEVLAVSPKLLVVNFTDPVSLFGLTIVGPDGSPIVLPGPREGLTKAVVLVDLPQLRAGVYRVLFGAEGADGVRVETRTTFTVAGPTTIAPAAGSADGGGQTSAGAPGGGADPTAAATTSTTPRPTIDPATATTFALPVIPEPQRKRGTLPPTSAPAPTTVAATTTRAPVTKPPATTRPPTTPVPATVPTLVPTSAVPDTTVPTGQTTVAATTTSTSTTTEAPLPTGPDRKPLFPIERDARGLPIVRGSVPGVPPTSAYTLPANSTGPDATGPAPATSSRGPLLLVAAALFGAALLYGAFLLLKPRRLARAAAAAQEPSLFGDGRSPRP